MRTYSLLKRLHRYLGILETLEPNQSLKNQHPYSTQVSNTCQVLMVLTGIR